MNIELIAFLKEPGTCDRNIAHIIINEDDWERARARQEAPEYLHAEGRQRRGTTAGKTSRTATSLFPLQAVQDWCSADEPGYNPQDSAVFDGDTTARIGALLPCIDYIFLRTKLWHYGRTLYLLLHPVQEPETRKPLSRLHAHPSCLVVSAVYDDQDEVSGSKCSNHRRLESVMAREIGL